MNTIRLYNLTNKTSHLLNIKKRKNNMIKNLLHLAIIGLVMYCVYLILAMVISGTILMIVGIILVIIFCIKVLETFGINL